MASFKALYCYFCVIMLLGVTMLQAEEKSASVLADNSPKGNCSCGGFPTTNPDMGSVPLLSQSPGLVVKCEDEGEVTCKSLCTALATATKAKGPEILCNKLKDADEIKLSAFYKICDKPWIYANMTADEPLCCADSKVKVCASTEKMNITAVAIDSTKTVL